MDIQHIVNRYAEMLQELDREDVDPGANARTGLGYSPGVKALRESEAQAGIDRLWQQTYPGEMMWSELGQRYESPVFRRGSLDHSFLADDGQTWAIEFKRIQFAGNNGKANDFATAKMLSPYLKDRGMLHDAARLREYGSANHVAIIGYTFNYDLDTVARAYELHTDPEAEEVVKNIHDLVAKNGNHLRVQPLVEFMDAILALRGFTIGPRAEADFEAWKHPAGGRGIVFGWEIRRPSHDPEYDVRHPW